MIKNNIILLISLFLVTASCSKKLTVENLNKPFYNNFEKNIKKSYKDIGNSISFKDYYEDGKYEIDRSVNIRNKVIDSLNLINKEKWLFVKLNSTNYSGTYEKTFIIFDNKCVYYDLPKPDMSQKLDVEECTIEDLKKQNHKDVFEIHNALENDNITKIKSDPDTNPLLNYQIILVRDKKIKSYKLSSKDYIIKKWQ